MPFALEHVTAWSDWLTPPKLIDSLGAFDLDPCASINPPWRTASSSFTREDNGLRKRWWGRVWLNPPYGRETEKWIARLAQHGRGTALIFARTETEMFFRWVWPVATALFFIKGRIPFYDSRGALTRSRAVAPSVLVAYGEDDAIRLKGCCYPGKLIRL